MPRRLNVHKHVHTRCLCALIMVALPALSYAGTYDDPTFVTADGGCKTWAGYDYSTGKASLMSWTGKCDEQGYATGNGTLSVKGGLIDVFIGEVRAGKMLTGLNFQNTGGPGCMPTPNSGQMTQGQLEAAANTGPCNRRGHSWWVQKAVVSEGGWYERDTVYYFGPDAQRIVDQTGNAALSARLRSMAPKRFQAPGNPPVKRDAPKPADDDACAKIKIVNGKKLCEE